MVSILFHLLRWEFNNPFYSTLISASCERLLLSAGGLPGGLSQEELFKDYSVPGNKELLRMLKDIGMVGSGVPRILESYDRSCFTFSDNFLRMSFPAMNVQVGSQVRVALEDYAPCGRVIIIWGHLQRKALHPPAASARVFLFLSLTRASSARAINKKPRRDSARAFSL